VASEIRRLELRMFNLGFAERGYRELLTAAEGTRDRWLRLYAYWHLINWHLAELSEEGAQTILLYASKVERLEVRPDRILHLAIVKSQALRVLGEMEKAQEVLQDRLLISAHPDLVLARAALIEDLDVRVEALNEVFRNAGLSEVGVLDAPGPAFDRLNTQQSRNVGTGEGPLISVIMPAYNAQATIATAIRSLLAQTWHKFEIIVVDDCSTDDTAELVVALAKQDRRIRLLRTERNSGAYYARNVGLKFASGKYVVCHDADDWSHPSKLQIHVEDLERRSERIVANFSALLFIDQDLRAASRRVGSYARKNTSSLMFRREVVVKRLGAWDPVRFGADSEFLERMLAVFGRLSVGSLSQPLSLVRYHESSLTASGPFGYRGYRMGARQFYRERYLQFHRSGRSLRLTGVLADRPFYVPEPMLPWRHPYGVRRHFDVVLVFDCRLGGADLDRSMEAIRKHRAKGLRVAALHIPLYEADPETPIQEAITRLLDQRCLDYLVPGERIACDTLHILKWPLLLDHNRYVLDVRPKTIEVMIDDTSPQRQVPTPEERERCDGNLRRYTDAPVTWRPYS